MLFVRCYLCIVICVSFIVLHSFQLKRSAAFKKTRVVAQWGRRLWRCCLIRPSPRKRSSTSQRNSRRESWETLLDSLTVRRSGGWTTALPITETTSKVTVNCALLLVHPLPIVQWSLPVVPVAWSRSGTRALGHSFFVRSAVSRVLRYRHLQSLSVVHRP